MRDTFVDSASKSLAALLWANAVDDLLEGPRGGDRTLEEAYADARALWAYVDGDPARLPDTAEGVRRELSVGGGDWMDVVPARTVLEARPIVLAWLELLERSNAASLETLWARVCAADPTADDGGRRAGLGRFAHCLVMEACGEGIGWHDDHDRHGLEIPRDLEHVDLDFGRA